MTEDASLDAFAPSEADDESADAGAESAADATETESATETSETDSAADTATTGSAASAADPVEPARSTYAWSPEGGECDDCGASVERRWRADGQKDGDLVCADCKEW